MTEATEAPLLTDALNIAFSPCPNDTFVFDAWALAGCRGRPRSM